MQYLRYQLHISVINIHLIKLHCLNSFMPRSRSSFKVEFIHVDHSQATCLSKYNHSLRGIKWVNPLCTGNKHYVYANWFDPGQPQSNSAAGLRSNLFATRTNVLHKKTTQIVQFLIADDIQIYFQKTTLHQRINVVQYWF